MNNYKMLVLAIAIAAQSTFAVAVGDFYERQQKFLEKRNAAIAKKIEEQANEYTGRPMISDASNKMVLLKRKQENDTRDVFQRMHEDVERRRALGLKRQFEAEQKKSRIVKANPVPKFQKPMNRGRAIEEVNYNQIENVMESGDVNQEVEEFAENRLISRISKDKLGRPEAVQDQGLLNVQEPAFTSRFSTFQSAKIFPKKHFRIQKVQRQDGTIEYIKKQNP
ncbi:hypothetical protein [Candidatus Hydrogenosomobacter endosymbioticus]|uniref:Uncharacterized protein n=1 Tax=Candidatus Hydrogenosomobacter endosymbioticus TaxID=2558174 RepID=A0ABM7V940_9PROT|nr:hypothetical protein [Candidatus Hydrogenosomobacter endosymbioticus]BDB95986.1 hypothetical protein HYD_1190 [Candidatus Hydrogenosomobacter endosymbioticus]